jgi:hypothetical protein
MREMMEEVVLQKRQDSHDEKLFQEGLAGGSYCLIVDFGRCN